MRAAVFAILACGYIPRCAVEADDAGEERLEKICRIISECPLSIHDLSRKGPDLVTGLSRFNMPFELGLCLGAKRFGRRKKALLVMETAAFDYQKFLSDLAGRDIKHHGDDPVRVIGLIRGWLNTHLPGRSLPGGAALSSRYQSFLRGWSVMLRNHQLDESEVTFVDWAHHVERWLVGPRAV